MATRKAEHLRERIRNAHGVFTTEGVALSDDIAPREAAQESAPTYYVSEAECEEYWPERMCEKCAKRAESRKAEAEDLGKGAFWGAVAGVLVHGFVNELLTSRSTPTVRERKRKRFKARKKRLPR